MPIVVRAATEGDMEAVQGIYAEYVLHSLATFDEIPPSVTELCGRREAIVQSGLPYLVATDETRVLGYAYASSYRPRAAYRFSVEDSVYVANGLQGKGIGSALLAELIARCEAGPWRQIIAVIGDSGNDASVALHRRFGFELVGTLRCVGFKLGRWVNTVLMQRELGAGDRG